MINSNFFGCSTGRSAGLAPLQDLVDVLGGAAVPSRCGSRRIGHQPAGLDRSGTASTSPGSRLLAAACSTRRLLVDAAERASLLSTRRARCCAVGGGALNAPFDDRPVPAGPGDCESEPLTIGAAVFGIFQVVLYTRLGWPGPRKRRPHRASPGKGFLEQLEPFGGHSCRGQSWPAR